jgi:hypothetical protein
MAVNATPTLTAQSPCDAPSPKPVRLTPQFCGGQNILTAPLSTVNKRPILSRMRAITVRSGQQAVIRWTMQDRTGNPVDLTDCLECATELDSEQILLTPDGETLPEEDPNAGQACQAPYHLKLRIHEYLAVGYNELVDMSRHEFPATIIDAPNGVVSATIPAEATNQPGVYFAEMALVNDDDAEAAEYILFSNIFYLYIDRSLWSRRGPHGPPSIAEVRLHLRDSDGNENFLLDNIKFDDAEIASAAVNALAYWNEIPPDIVQHTSQTMPYRYHWLEGICGQLFMMAAEQFRANRLQYSAAGVNIDDQDKEQNYEAAAARRWSTYTEFVRRKKAELNLEACWGGIGSGYALYGYAQRNSGGYVCK